LRKPHSKIGLLSAPTVLANYRKSCTPPIKFLAPLILNLYYDVEHLRWYKRPDWFAVVGVSSLYGGAELRQSYVRWQEQKDPIIVVEFLSPGTEDDD
jgi:Uma2 family endonuclease